MNCLSGCCEKHGDKIVDASVMSVTTGSGICAAVAFGTAVVGASIFGLYKICESVYSSCIKDYNIQYNVTEATDYIKHQCSIDATAAGTFSFFGLVFADVIVIGAGVSVLIGGAFQVANCCLQCRKVSKIEQNEGKPLLPLHLEGRTET